VTDRITPPLLAWGTATDAGLVRGGNEDAFVAEPMVFGVADGMGGHQAGEVASAIAAGTLRDRLAGGAATVDVAVAAVVEANAAIFQGAYTNAEQRGMGTTLTAITVLAVEGVSPKFVLVNVGDSRTYVMRAGRLRRVSIDHSYVQELVSTGHITELEARNHPRRNIVTRALGIEPTVRVDTWVLPLVKGDRYVLCSDGLVDEVDDEEITAVLAANPLPQAAAEALVAAANQHGGRDNTTVVVVDVLEGDDMPGDTAAMDIDPTWADDEHERLIDAEAGNEPTAGLGPIPMMTIEPPAAPKSRRKGLGIVLFVFALGLIITLTVTLVLVVRHNANDSPVTTTSSTSSTSSTTSTSTTSTTTTTSPTSSTVAPSSSAAGP
jgi:protein phosphatase